MKEKQEKPSSNAVRGTANTVGKRKRSVNLSYLKDLADGDTAFIRDIINMFCTDAPGAIKQMQLYYKTENCELLKITAHKMKSSALTLGNKLLAKKLATVEEVCEAGSDGAEHPERNKMSVLLKEVYLEINNMINDLEKYRQPR